jgi:hypothetical protein
MYNTFACSILHDYRPVDFVMWLQDVGFISGILVMMMTDTGKLQLPNFLTIGMKRQ